MFSTFPLTRLFDHVGFNLNINSGHILLYIVLWIIIPRGKDSKAEIRDAWGSEESFSPLETG